MSKIDSLNKAKENKNDEFYTCINDISNEVLKYKSSLFHNKIIFCNCDDPKFSQFYTFITHNFILLKLKKAIFTYYTKNKNTNMYTLEIKNGVLSLNIEEIKSNGDFRDNEIIKILKSSDIVITNPPFSLFRDHISQILEYDKKFLVIGSLNAIGYKEIFREIKEEKIQIGQTFPKSFLQPDGSKKKFGNICWFTNMKYFNDKKPLILNKKYYDNVSQYLTYDNYDAINVSKIKDIPSDYFGDMGVPITFLYQHDITQFKIVGLTSGRYEFECQPTKRYINPKQINKDGSMSNGSKVNTRAVIKIKREDIIKDDVYYIAHNIDYTLKSIYARILIRRIIN